MFWEAVDDGTVKCTTCPNFCRRGEGGITQCKTRINRGGKLYSLTYDSPCLIREDPLAKNPLYHATPGASAIGVATAGCNLSCKYCQNWEISQVGPRGTKNMDVTADELVGKARDRGLEWITFSYTEPVAYLEYAIDVARAARKHGVKIAIATAGYICPGPLAELARHTDAFSVTLKGYTEKFYREVCGCGLRDVQRAISTIARSGKWMEVATLIVPGLNDDADGLRAIARFVARAGRDIPLHFLRFSPAYKLRNLPPTPLKTLETARAAALEEGLRYVYIDLSGHSAANTVCPACGTALIERAGFTVIRNNLKYGGCPRCSRRIPGLWK